MLCSLNLIKTVCIQTVKTKCVPDLTMDKCRLLQFVYSKFHKYNFPLYRLKEPKFNNTNFWRKQKEPYVKYKI